MKKIIIIKKFLTFFIRPIYRHILNHKFEYISSIDYAMRYNEREKMLQDAMNFTADAKTGGDYLEFGVASGNSFISAYHLAKIAKLDSMKFYAFDSFEGLPEIRGKDNDGQCNFKKGQFVCNLEKFETNLIDKKVDMLKVKIIKGWYKDTLKKKYSIKRVSVVWVDCDLYESTVFVLDFIKDYITEGSIIIFDDWHCFKSNPNKGEQRAFWEWKKNNPDIELVHYKKFGWRGNSFLVQYKPHNSTKEGRGKASHQAH